MLNEENLLLTSLSSKGQKSHPHRTQNINICNHNFTVMLLSTVRTDTMLKFYKTVATPCLMYKTETWKLTKGRERNTDS